ncbi:MAG: translocation/assembly module TamB domain-containing protein [Deltaproteobacteria bacterium]|nr:translocation/assembly module TamB domain-containing protein [Deltaproteobacteria bacterium]
MWRRSFVILAIVCGAILGVGVALKSPRVAANIIAALEKLARDRYHTALEIDHLELELLPPGLTVDGVRVGRLESPEPWLALHHGRLLIRPWPSPSGAVVLHRLELDGLRLALDLDAPPPVDAAPPDDAHDRGRIKVDVNELLLFNTSASFAVAGGTVRLRGLDVEVRPSRRGRDIAVELDEGVLLKDGVQIGFEAKAKGEMVGSFDRIERLLLSRGVVNLERVALGAHGEVTLGNKPALAFDLDTRGPASRLNDFFDELPPLGGMTSVTMKIRGTPKAPRLEVALTVDDARVGDANLGQVEMHAIYQAPRIQLQSFRLQNRGAGTATGSGQLDLGPSLPLTMDVRLHDASLPHILELAGLKDAWVQLGYGGDVQVSGTLQPLRLTLGIDGSIERFVVQGGSYKDTGATEYLALGPTEIRGPATLSTTGVQVNGAQLKLSGSSLTVDGSLWFDPARGMDLRAISDRLDLAALGPIAAVPVAGAGAVATTIEGPYADPTISGTVDLDDLTVYDIELGATKGTLIYSSLVLAIDRASVRRNDAAIELALSFGFTGAVPTVSGTTTFPNLALTDVLANVGIESATAARFDARGSGEARVDGPLAFPAGTATFAADGLKVDGARIGRLRIATTFGDRQTPLALDLHLSPDTGSLRTEVRWQEDGQLQINTEAEELSLSMVRPFLGDVPVSGRLTGRARLHGPPRGLSGKAQAAVERLTAYGVRLETTTLDAALAGGEVEIAGTVLTGAAAVKATLNLQAGLAYTLNATFTGLEASRLWPLPRDLHLLFSGSFFSQGALAEPQGIMADAELDTMSLSWGGLTLRAARPVVLQYAAQSARVVNMVLQNAGTELNVDGSLSTAGVLAIRAQATGDLKALNAVTTKVEWIRGRFDLATAIHGMLGAPRLLGSVTLSDGALRLSTAGQVLDQVNVRAQLSGRSLDVVSGAATLGAGEVGLSGQVLFPGDQPLELNLRTEVKNVTLRPSPDLSATLSGVLYLSGPKDDLLLRGRLRVPALRYTANLDLERLIPRRNAPPLRVPAFEAEHAIRVAVALQAANNLVLTNNIIEAELGADLTLTGTTERLGLIGSLTPLWAKARYRDNVFKLERGTIDFSEEHRIYTQFDLRATTEACGMQISVDVHGNSDQYNVVPGGQDKSGAVAPQDVLACLQFGMRLRDFEAQGRPADDPQASGGGALSDPMVASGLDVLWTVSGVDATVKRLLPIKLDEVRLESGWSSFFRRTTTRVLVGKDLGAKLQLKYSRALDEVDDQTVSVQYRLSNVAALRGSWLSASDVYGGDFGLDLRLRWEFR